MFLKLFLERLEEDYMYMYSRTPIQYLYPLQASNISRSAVIDVASIQLELRMTGPEDFPTFQRLQLELRMTSLDDFQMFHKYKKVGLNSQNSLQMTRAGTKAQTIRK